MTKPEQPDSESSSSSLMATQIIHSSQALAVGATLANRFEIESLQGQGRYGLVYRALDKQLETMVAIKVLDKSLSSNQQTIADFKNELLLVRQLSHPNIIRVHEYYQENDLHFITMDWIEGDSLENIIAGGTLDKDAKLSVIKQLLSGLSFAQNAGVTHKDIKPENIMLDHDGRLFIADFGLSVFNKDMTSTVRSGTPYYAPPEYLQNGTLNDTTDLYAAGVIIFQLLCDDLPFKGNNIEQVLTDKSLSQPNFKCRGNTFKKYKNWVLKLIAAHPEARHKNIEDALQRFLKLEQQKTPYSFAPIAASALFLIVLIGYFTLQNDPTKFSPGIDNVYAVAVLPKTKQDESELADFNRLLERELLLNPQLRVAEEDRIRTIYQQLGFNPPLSDKQLLTVFELLNTDILVQISKLQAGQNAERISFQLVHLTGQTIHSENFLEVDLNADDWQSSIESFIAKFNNKLDLQSNAANSITRQTKPDSKAYELFQKAETFFYNGQYFEAEQHYSQTIQTLKNLTEQTYIGVLSQARLNELANKIEKAEEHYLKLTSAFPYDIDLKIKLAELYEFTEQPGKVISVLKELVALDPNHPSAWFMLGKAAYAKGDFDRAVDEYFLRALVIAKKLKDLELQAKYLNAFGVVYEQIGDSNLAIDYYLQALTQRQAIGDKPGVAKTLTNLADVYLVLGQWVEAEKMLFQSKNIYEQLGDKKGIANNLNALGLLAEEQAHFQRALQYYRESLNMRLELNLLSEQAESMNNIGYAYFMLLDPEHSLVYWRQAEQLYQQVKSPIGIIRVRQSLAQMELVKGNWSNAYRIFNSTLTDASQINSLEESIVAKAYLSQLAFLQGNFNASIAELSEIHAQLQQKDDKRGISHFGLYLVDWHLQVGNTEAAKQMLDNISELIKRSGSQAFKSRLQYLKLKLELEQRFSEPSMVSVEARSFMLQETNKVIDELDLDAATDRPHRKLYIQTMLDKVAYQLRFPDDLSPTDLEKISAIVNTLQSIDFKLFHFEQLQLYTLVAKLQWLKNDWLALKETLRTAEMSLRKSGDYWLSVKLDALRIVLAKHENRQVSGYQLKFDQKLTSLTKNLTEEQRKPFIYRAGLQSFISKSQAEHHE